MMIPNLVVGKFVKEDGYLSDEAMGFMQTLITQLTENAGKTGLVVPSLTTSEISIIVNNQTPDGQYTCQFGTLLLDNVLNKLYCVINNGSGVPLLKEVSLI